MLAGASRTGAETARFDGFRPPPIEFDDRDGYRRWRRRWRTEYADLARAIQQMKKDVSGLSSAFSRGHSHESPANMQRVLLRMQEAASRAMMSRRASKVIAAHL